MAAGMTPNVDLTQLNEPNEGEPIWLRPYPSEKDHRAMLGSVFAGVDTGAYDERILDWLAGSDSPTVATVVSLVVRARAAGPLRPS